MCLSWCSMALERHHDQGDSCERKHLHRGLLTVSETLSILVMMGAWWQAGAGGVAERYILICRWRKWGEGRHSMDF